MSRVEEYVPLTYKYMFCTEWAADVLRAGHTIPAVDQLMNYRCQGEDELFEVWCDHFFRPAYGSKEFRDRTQKKPLSEIQTVFDEAFVVATIDNNYDRWVKESELVSQGIRVDKKTLPQQKYTNDAAASKKFQGWAEEGIEFFNKIVNDLMQVRNTSTSKVLERTYMENLHDTQARRAKKDVMLPVTEAVDGIQDYLKNFFPQGISGRRTAREGRWR